MVETTLYGVYNIKHINALYYPTQAFGGLYYMLSAVNPIIWLIETSSFSVESCRNDYLNVQL